MNNLIEAIKRAQGWLSQTRDNMAQAAYKELTLALKEINPDPPDEERPKKKKKFIDKIIDKEPEQEQEEN